MYSQRPEGKPISGGNGFDLYRGAKDPDAASSAGNLALGRGVKAGPLVEHVEGDLLRQPVEAIVNSWNRNFIPYWLLLPQGVSGAIKREGGTGPFKELRAFGVLPLGAARLTSAGTLPFKGIIHVAGIDLAWRSSDESVRKSVQSALTIAKNQKYESIAFPAIGAGSSIRVGSREIPVWGVSRERSLKLITEEVSKSDYPGKVIIVRFKPS